MNPRNKWLLSIGAGLVVGLMAGVVLSKELQDPNGVEKVASAEEKPLWQNNVVELADYNPFPSRNKADEKTVVGAGKKTVPYPEGRHLATPRVFPTIPQIPTRNGNIPSEKTVQDNDMKHKAEMDGYSTRIAFIGGDGLGIKEKGE